MTLICFASQKGSPGTSAAALAVAAAFRPGEGRRKLLLEADLAGGALAIRYRLPTDPGLVTLAAAARAGMTGEELWRHACELPGGLPAIVCPDGPEQVHSALAAAGPLLGRHLAERRDLDVIADLGRLQPGSPAVELAAEATAVLMVARPVAEQLQPAAQRMLALRPRIKNLGWLLVGEKPHGPAEVESTFGFPVVGVLADDRRSVEAIEGGEITRRVRRHPFVRSAATVAGTLGTWLSPLASVPASPETAEQPSGEGDRNGERPPSNEVTIASGPAPDRDPDPAPVTAPADPLLAAPAPMPESTPMPGSMPASDRAVIADVAMDSLADSVPIPDHTGDTLLPEGPNPAVAEGRAAAVSAAAAEIDPPAMPTPPLPPPRPTSGDALPPDPFVHGDDDVEWTGT